MMLKFALELNPSNRDRTTLQPKLPQMMIQMFILRFAPLLAAQLTKKTVNITVRASIALTVKLIYQFN